MLNKKYDFICSIGEDCACSTYMRSFKLQDASYPFDWLTKASFTTRISLVLNDFKSFLDIQYFKFLPKTHLLNDDRCDYYENTVLDFYFYHDFIKDIPIETSFPSVRLKYERRIKRLYERIEKANNILFIWWSRDKLISTDVLLEAQDSLSKKFPNKTIDLLVFENNFDTENIEYIELSKNILKVISNFAFYDTSKPERETLANVSQSNKVFSQIKIKRSLAYWVTCLLSTSTLFLCKFIPIKNVRKKVRRQLKEKLKG